MGTPISTLEATEEAANSLEDLAQLWEVLSLERVVATIENSKFSSKLR